jgi:ABC-type molybdenum transport system ATPase subunit/photorepair protein PhrA
VRPNRDSGDDSFSASYREGDKKKNLITLNNILHLLHLPLFSYTMAPIPITILTGFLGSGKTTLLLNLLPQLLSQNPSYKLALLKNEFGDLAIDSQLASASSIGGVRELLNGCICCNLVGQLDEALRELAVSEIDIL